MNSLFIIISASLCGVFCALLIKDKVPHIAFALSSAVCIAISLCIIPLLNTICSKCITYINIAHIDSETIKPLFKVTIIALVTKYGTELCRDAGQNAIAAKIELAGTAMGMICALPLLEKALNMIGAL